jgi:hypothetical protein
MIRRTPGCSTSQTRADRVGHRRRSCSGANGVGLVHSDQFRGVWRPPGGSCARAQLTCQGLLRSPVDRPRQRDPAAKAAGATPVRVAGARQPSFDVRAAAHVPRIPSSDSRGQGGWPRPEHKSKATFGFSSMTSPWAIASAEPAEEGEPPFGVGEEDGLDSSGRKRPLDPPLRCGALSGS